MLAVAAGPVGWDCVYTWSVNQQSSGAVRSRVPTLLDEALGVITRRPPIIVAPGTPLGECLRAVERSGRGDSVLVCKDGRLVGVLTERDIFGRIVGQEIDPSEPVDRYVNTEPHTLSFDSTVRDAIALMQTGRYRNVPLVDAEGRAIGIVRPQDILRYLAEAFPQALLNLPPRPHQRHKESEGA